MSLLDPDRYEFYTFNDDGELEKRLMTMDEIQRIVANGDSEQQSALAKNPTGIVDNEENIRDIVNNVQKVLHSEMVNNNFTASLMYNKLDTPDTSSSWSSILPAIFGNNGDSIIKNKAPVTNGNMADTVIMTTTNKRPPLRHKTSNSSSIIKTTPPNSGNDFYFVRALDFVTQMELTVVYRQNSMKFRFDLTVRPTIPELNPFLACEIAYESTSIFIII